MKVGIVYNTGSHGVDPAAVIAVARHAESCGFESFYVTEHIALYRAPRSGRSNSRLLCLSLPRWSC